MRWPWQRQVEINPALWQQACASVPALDYLWPAERQRLHAQAEALLSDKQITPLQGLTLSEFDVVRLALLLVMPVVNLSARALDNFHEVVLYPQPITLEHQHRDDSGVVHQQQMSASGLTARQSALILVWPAVEQAGRGHGHNVVAHELAHKLDLRDGYADGMPPLESHALELRWQHAIDTLQEDLQRHLQRHHRPPIDPYASVSPAEAFAVCSEYFCDAPGVLAHHYPELYALLGQFYRRQPRLGQRPTRHG